MGRSIVMWTLAALLLTAAPAAAQEDLSQPCRSATANVKPDGSRVFDLCGFNSRVQITRAPQHGQISPQIRRGAGMRYTPHPGYSGSDSFAFRRVGAPAGVPDAEMTITVTAANSAPYCSVEPAVSTTQDRQLGFYLPCEDPDEGDALRLQVVQDPQHGHMFVSGSGMYYTPARGFTGTDSFVIRADDGNVSSPDAAVEVSVEPVTPAVCTPKTLTVKKNGVRDLSGSCAGLSLYNINFLGGLAHGGLVRETFGALYAPDDDFVGTDELTFVGRTDSSLPPTAPATVTLDVTEEGNAPECLELAGALQVRSGRTTDAGVYCWDHDREPLELSVPEKPYRGAVLASTFGNFVYTSDAGYAGADRFAVRASDGILGRTLTQQIRILAEDENTAPWCRQTPARELMAGQAYVEVSCIDDEQDPLTVEVGAAAHGTTEVVPGMFGPAVHYVPGADFSGSDRFTYQASDGRGGKSAPMTVRVLAAPPVEVALSCPPSSTRSLRTGKSASIWMMCSDFASPSQQIHPTVVDGPDHGTLVPGQFTDQYVYTPDAGFTGHDEITLRASKGDVHRDVTFGYDVDPAANEVPLCFDQPELTARAAVTIAGMACYDPDSDPLTYSVKTAPEHGSLSGTPPASVTYTPDAGFSGSDRVVYTVTDGYGGSAEVSQFVRVRGETQNVGPRCTASVYGLQVDQSVQMHWICRDADNDPITYEVVSPPQHGTLQENANGVTYTPNAGYIGLDSLTLRADDGRTASAPVTIGVQVQAAGQPSMPICQPFAANVAPNQARPLSLKCPWGTLGFTIEVAQAPEHGTLSDVGEDGTVTYTPHPGYSGPDAFAFRARKGDQVGQAATVTLDVRTPPVLPDDVTLERAIGPDPPGPVKPPETPKGEPDVQTPAGTPESASPPPSPPSTVTPPLITPSMRDAALQAMGIAIRAVLADLGGAEAFIGALAPRLSAKKAKVLAIACAQGCSVKVSAKLVAGRRSVKLPAQSAKLARGRASAFGYRATAAQRRRLGRPKRAVLVLDVTVRDADDKLHRRQIRVRVTLR
jgi:hypothetical protein